MLLTLFASDDEMAGACQDKKDAAATHVVTKRRGIDDHVLSAVPKTHPVLPWKCRVPFAYLVSRKCRQNDPFFNCFELVQGMMQ